MIRKPKQCLKILKAFGSNFLIDRSFNIPIFRSYSDNNNNLSRIISKFRIDEFLENPQKFIEENQDIVIDELKSKSLAGSGIIAKLSFFTPLLVWFQSFTGFPYWLTIGLFSMMMRMSMIPLYYLSTNEEHKAQKYGKELKQIEMKQQFARTQEEKELYQRELYEANEKFGIKTSRRLLVLVPLSMFIPMFATLKYMASTIPLLQQGGFWWFTNLAAADPYFILPIVNSLLLFMNVKLNQKYLMTQDTPKFMKYIIYGSILLSTVITMKFKACFFVFWIPLQLVQVGQTFGFHFLRKWNEKKSQSLIYEEIDEEEDEDFLIVDSSNFYKRNDDDF